MCRRIPGDEGLAGCYSIDTSYLFNGVFQDFLRAVAVERRYNVELSGNYVGLHKVRECLKPAKSLMEHTSYLHQCKGDGLLVSLLTVRNMLKREGCLSSSNAFDLPDLLNSAEGRFRVVGSQLNRKVEPARHRSNGFNVRNVLQLSYRMRYSRLDASEDPA